MSLPGQTGCPAPEVGLSTLLSSVSAIRSLPFCGSKSDDESISASCRKDPFLALVLGMRAEEKEFDGRKPFPWRPVLQAHASVVQTKVGADSELSLPMPCVIRGVEGWTKASWPYRGELRRTARASRP